MTSSPERWSAVWLVRQQSHRFAGLWVGDDFFVPWFEEPATVAVNSLYSRAIA